jgi:dissimilatory sulfite reductase (desulfoviridin) alpha/beta subunit
MSMIDTKILRALVEFLEKEGHPYVHMTTNTNYATVVVGGSKDPELRIELQNKELKFLRTFREYIKVD